MAELEKNSRIDKALNWAITIIGLLMVLFHMINAKSYIMVSTQFFNGHLLFALVLVYLGAALKAKKLFVKWLMILGTLIIFACTVYVHFNFIGIQNRTWALNSTDIVIGACIIILSVISVKLSIGWFMLILISGIAIYPFFGQYLPEPFTTKSYSISQTIGNFAMNLNTGIYGNNLRTSAEYIFLFVVFGASLSATGVQKFFWELGKILFRKHASGPGLMAVMNSALVGSVTGSALANIMITGGYTIPAMKRAGYTGEEAGALEAAASSGGQIMPPVMGIVAFIMAAYTGIPYIRIVSMAIMPAILYYLGVALYAHYVTIKRRKKQGVGANTDNLDFFQEGVDYRTFYWKMPGFVIPLVLIVVLLANNFTVMEAGFWAIICLLVVSMAVPKDLRPNIKGVIDGLVSGAKEGAGLGVVIFTSGIILVTFTGSGLAVKLASGIMRFSGGTVFGVLMIVWVMSILFGMIGVSTVAYYMSAAFAASVLLNAGLPLETTHFFLMFPCIFSVITPPVALADVVAAKLAGSDYLKTSYETVRAAFTAFFLPFLVVYAPAIILRGSPSSPIFWMEIFICALFVVAGEFCFIGYFKMRMTWTERILLGAVFVLCLAFLVSRIPLFFGIIIGATVAFIISHFIRFKKLRAEEKLAASV